MSVLNVIGIRKILGAQELLRGADLRIERGEKMGCVGRNGEGKTTLLRLIEGEETPDAGVVQLSRGSRIGYVQQRPHFEPGVSVLTYVEAGLEEVHRLERELEDLAHRMGEAHGEELDSIVKLHGELTERMDFLGGWEAERRVETVLSGIGLAQTLWSREARTLSGGEKSRTALARELVSVPDLLLLDEPTNHLDLAGIEWLEAYLREIKSAVFIVSHDRRLLDSMVDVIVEVSRGKLNRYPGNYSRYVQRKEERFAEDHKAWTQQQDLIRREENFIKKHMGSQRTAEAKGRLKKLSHVVRLERPYDDVRRPRIRVASVERGGEEVLGTEKLQLGYNDVVLLDDINLRVGRGERIGVVGPNGTGKSTLLKVLAGRAQPMGGEIKLGHKANCGYFDQEVADLRDDGTPYSEIRRDHPQMTDLEIRSHLARFLFRGKEIDLTVHRLSGGERARLSLARLVLTGPSWLALDEPTNHLDLPARTALEEMLSEFPGAMVCISHDRAFLDSLVHTIIEVKDGRVRTFRGNYSEYKASLEEPAAAPNGRVASKSSGSSSPKVQPPSQRKAGGDPGGPKGNKTARKSSSKKQGKSPAQASKPKQAGNPWRLEKIEAAIIQLEGRREEILASLATEEVYKDPEARRTAQFDLADVERDLEEKNREWERYAG